jgi:hypothetical protein
MPVIAEVPWFFTHIFPWGFIVAGTGYSFDNLTAIIRASQSHRWPTVEATVIRSEVAEEEIGESSASMRVQRMEYAYVVEGKKYKGTRVTSSDSALGSKEEASTFLKTFRYSAKVTVHYCPTEPQTALLKPGIRGRLIFNFVFALLTLIMGLAMLIFMPLIGRLPHATW